MFYVYIIRSEITGKHYVGCTKDLETRMKQHNKRQNLSTRNGAPWKLLVYKTVENQEQAYNLEKKVKSYKGGNAFKKILKGEVAEWSIAAAC